MRFIKDEIQHPRSGEELLLFRLSGEMTKGARIASLIDEIREQLRSGYRTLVFDCQNVFYVNSGGVDEILRIYRSIQSYEGSLVLIRVQPGVKEVFHLTPEIESLPIHPSLEHFLQCDR